MEGALGAETEQGGEVNYMSREDWGYKEMQCK